jgi:LPXTG-motif cell wall-anchored protein
MHLSRRIAALLAVALLAGAPAVAHAQGSAGDDQYQDPFGGSTSGGKKSGGSKNSGSGSSSSGSSSTGSSSTGSSGTTGSSGSTSSGTTSAPATSSSTTGSSSSSGSTAAPAATSSGSRQELPRTGLDAPVIALLGIGLLAAGVGLRLRLRTVDGRR